MALSPEKIDKWLNKQKYDKIAKALSDTSVSLYAKEKLLQTAESSDSELYKKVLKLPFKYLKEIGLPYEDLLVELAKINGTQVLLLLIEDINYITFKEIIKDAADMYDIRKDQIMDILQKAEVSINEDVIKQRVRRDIRTAEGFADIKNMILSLSLLMKEVFYYTEIGKVEGYFKNLIRPLTDILASLGVDKSLIEFCLIYLDFSMGLFMNKVASDSAHLRTLTDFIGADEGDWNKFKKNITRFRELLVQRKKLMEKLIIFFPDLNYSRWDEKEFYAGSESELVSSGFLTNDQIKTKYTWSPIESRAKELFEKYTSKVEEKKFLDSMKKK